MMEKTMRDRLESIAKRDNEINEMMMDPSVLSDRKILAKLGKEKVSMQGTMEAYQKFLEAEMFYNQAIEMIEGAEEAELVELATMEKEEYGQIIEELLEVLEVLLIP